jgi:hypothetical protein
VKKTLTQTLEEQLRARLAVASEKNRAAILKRRPKVEANAQLRTALNGIAQRNEHSS